MDVDDLILVSVDDHVVEPPDMFEGRLPARYADQAPYVTTRDDGTEIWRFDGKEATNIGLNAVVGRPPEEYGLEPTSFAEIRPGCYDIDRRIDDMNAGGILGSLCFPSFPQLCGQLFAKASDKDLGLAVLQAYNDWHVEEWCGTYPGRFIPLALAPIWDPEAMAAEMHRVAAKGVRAVTFSENPAKLKLPSLHSPHWDPFWAACSDLDIIVCLHIGSSSSLVMTAADAPIDVLLALQPVNIVQAAADLLFSPVLGKFPDLRFSLSEGGIGWIPYFLERMDWTYARQHRWTGMDFGDRLPSQVFSERVVVCFIDDPVGVALRHRVGLDRICWESDYPHSDSSWPTSPELLMKSLDAVPGGVPDDEVDQITHRNACHHFRFDPFAHRPRAGCTVGALRGEAAGVDTAVRAGAGGPSRRKATKVSDLTGKRGLDR
jgi:predicted TIM-barrel fold metal-dependent hydrolase